MSFNLAILDSLESTSVFGQTIWFHSRTTKSGKSFGYVIRKSDSGMVIETYSSEVFQKMQESLNWLGKRTSQAKIDLLSEVELPSNFFSEISGCVVFPEEEIITFLEEEKLTEVQSSVIENTSVVVKLTAAEKKRINSGNLVQVSS